MIIIGSMPLLLSTVAGAQTMTASQAAVIP
jgi:hypothetical protein